MFVPSGILLQKDDLGAVTVSRSVSTGDGNLCLKDMSDAMLAVLFVAAGSDYCKSLTGIGLVTACEIVYRSFLQKPSGSEEKRQPPLAKVFELLFQRTYDRQFQGDTRQQAAYKEKFLAALLMYRHPVVYSPFQQSFITAGGKHGDPELTSYRPYKELLDDSERRAQVVGDLMESPMATFIAEGWVSPRTKQLYESAKNDCKLPKAVKCHFGLEEGMETQLIEGQSADAADADISDPGMQFDDPEERPMADNDAEKQQSLEEVSETNPASQEKETQDDTQPGSGSSQPETQEGNIHSNADDQEIEMETQLTTDSVPPQTREAIPTNFRTLELDTQEDSQFTVDNMRLETQAPVVDACETLDEDEDVVETDDGMPLTQQLGFALPMDESGEAAEVSREHEDLEPQTQPEFVDLSMVDSEDEALPIYSVCNYQATVKGES